LDCSQLGVLVLPDTYKKISALLSKNSKAKKTSSNNYNKNAYPSFIHSEKQPPSCTKSQLSHRITRKKTINPHSNPQVALKTLCRRVRFFVNLDSEPMKYQRKLRELSSSWNKSSKRVRYKQKRKIHMC
jgi:hypothetical protein